MNISMHHPRAQLLSRSRALPLKSTSSSCIAGLPAAVASSPASLPPRPFLPPHIGTNKNLQSLYQKNQRPRRPTTTTHAAAAPAAAGQTMMFGRAFTGIPLMELFQTMTLQEAAIESTIRVSFIVIAVLFGNQIIPWFANRVGILLGKLVHSHRRKTRGIVAQFLGSLIAAAETPCQALLPWFGFAYVSTVLSCFGEIAVTRLGGSRDAAGGAVAGAFKAISQKNAKQWVNSSAVKLVEIFTEIAQLMQDAYEVVAVIFVAWFLLNLKNQLVKNILANSASNSSDTGEVEDDLARIVHPVSSLINWGVVVATAFISLTVVGIDVKPLLALGSVSGLAIGFAAQSTVANVVSAFSLYTTRPFIAGDRVQLKTMNGQNVVSGTIDKILPLHTILKTDNGTPIFIHNKDMAGTLLVINESRILQSATTPALPSLDQTITVRYQDVDKVGAIQKQVTEWMKAHPDRLPGAPCKCTLQGFNSMGAVLSIKATLKRDADSRKSQVFTDMLLFAENAVRRNGAYLAMDPQIEMPPPLTR